MDDESYQTSRNVNSVGTEDHLHKVIDELCKKNEMLQLMSDSAMSTLEELHASNFSLHDSLTSITKEKDSLKSLNTLLTKRIQEKGKDLVADDFTIDKLQSEIKNLKLQNEELKSEIENVKLQNETPSSEVDKLMVLYRCSEKEKYIASMKLVDTEDNMRELEIELCSLKTKMHKIENNEENVQTSFDVGSEVTDPACFLSSIQDQILSKTKHVNERTKLEISNIQSMKNDKRLLEKEIMSLIGKADAYCDEFEAKFEEKRSCLITRLTSCNEQIRGLKKSYLQLGQLKREKLVKWLALCPVIENN